MVVATAGPGTATGVMRCCIPGSLEQENNTIAVATRQLIWVIFFIAEVLMIMDRLYDDFFGKRINEAVF
jgi:hypothetical protein